MTTTSGVETPRRRPKGRKQQIVREARELFVERGYPSVPMTLVAERVGITAGALYRHFDSKIALLEAVFHETFSHLSQPIEGDTISEAIDNAISKVITHQFVGDLWTREARHLPGSTRRALRQQMREWTHTFLPGIRSRRPGLDAGQEELLTWALQSALASLVSSVINAPSESRRPVVRGAMLAIASAEITPTGTALREPAPGLIPTSRRERLLLAAAELFDKGGYHETSMADIGAAADVTGPNLYGYFENKASLLQAVHQRGVAASWLMLDRALSQASSAHDALQRLIVGHIDLSRVWRVNADLPRADWFEPMARASGREYVDEWVALLRQITPDITAREARLRVLIAVTIVSDLTRTPHVANIETFKPNLANLVSTVLLDTETAAD